MLLWEIFSGGSPPYPGMSNIEAKNKVKYAYSKSIGQYLKRYECRIIPKQRFHTLYRYKWLQTYKAIKTVATPQWENHDYLIPNYR